MSHIALIACGSRKADHRVPARDLYLGDLFRKSLRYAEEVLRADKIFVLSAKHELLPLDVAVAPYDMTLNRMSSGEVQGWATRVLQQLRDEADLENDRFTFLAGETYRKYLVPFIRHYDVPMEGLRIGKQLGFLKRAIENE